MYSSFDYGLRLAGSMADFILMAGQNSVNIL